MHDVVCVGAGLIGGVTSALIKKSSHLPRATKVLLLDSAKRPNFHSQVTKNIRQIAVNPSSRMLLDDIGAWSKIVKSAWPVDKMTVWDAMGKGGLEFTGKNDLPLSHIVEVGLISRASVDAAEEIGVELKFESKIEEMILPDRYNPKIHDTDFATIKIKDEEISSRLILGCDGANSFVRSKAGLPSFSKEYNQRGFVCTVEIDPVDENKTAYQRFLPNSEVIAMLPCAENQMSIVWSCGESKAKSLDKLHPEKVVENINQVFNKRFETEFAEKVHETFSPIAKAIGMKTEIGPIKVPEVLKVLSPKGSFPLATAGAPQMVAPRVALLGDAAHRVHPFAGQGANMGYRDCELLLDALEKNHLDGIDFTSELALADYQKAAIVEQGVMLTGLDQLKNIYSSSFMPLVLARNLGTNLINNSPALKELFIAKAS